MRLLQRHGHDGCLVAVRRVCVLATEAGDGYGPGDRVGRLMVGRVGSIAVVPSDAGVGMVMTGVWWRSGVCVLATVVKGPSKKYGRHPRLVDRAAKIATFF